MTQATKRMTMGLALTAGLLIPATADAQRQVRVMPPEAQIEVLTSGRHGSNVKGVQVFVNRPSWVSLFAVRPDGTIRRLTRAEAGRYAAPRQPLTFNFKNSKANRAARRGEWIVALTSAAPMHACAIPYLESVMFDVYFDGRWRDQTHEATVCRLAGVRRGQVHVTAVRLGRAQGRVYGPQCATVAQFGRRIPAGSRLFVNGQMCGIGAGALWGLAPGQHRVSVLTPSGRKFSDLVKVDGGRRSVPYRASNTGRYHTREYARTGFEDGRSRGIYETFENEFDD
jgi:hypothetical protein